MSTSERDNTEISAVIMLDIVVDNVLFALDSIGNPYSRKDKAPISVAQREYSIVALIQLFVSLEGYINRVLYLLSDGSNKYFQAFRTPNVESKIDVVLDNTLESQRISKSIKESVALRNAIIHAHLYETSRDEGRKIKKIENQILLMRASYTSNVNQNTFRTRINHFHVVPSEVGFDDVVKMLKLWNKLYRRLNKIHGNIGYLHEGYPHRYVWYLKSEGRTQEINKLENKLMLGDGFEDLLEYIEDTTGYYRGKR